MQDFSIADDNDLGVWLGDLAVGPSDLQHAGLLLATTPGDWKAAPEVGVGLRRFSGGPMNQGALLATLQSEFKADGLSIVTSVTGSTLTLALPNV